MKAGFSQSVRLLSLKVRFLVVLTCGCSSAQSPLPPMQDQGKREF